MKEGRCYDRLSLRIQRRRWTLEKYSELNGLLKSVLKLRESVCITGKHFSQTNNTHSNTRVWENEPWR